MVAMARQVQAPWPSFRTTGVEDMNIPLRSHPRRHQEAGMATIEMIPLLLVFLMLISYTIGFFGVIHTGILQNIAARTYAFEMYRNRANLTHFRSNRIVEPITHFKDLGGRANGIISEAATDSTSVMFATERPIAKGFAKPVQSGRDQGEFHSTDVHSNRATDMRQRNETLQSNPVWLLVQYGICISAACDQQQRQN
jgi:hypothetical protein